MIKIIVLAAGNGTRMNADLPKVLVPLKGRPMVKYLLDSIISSGVSDRPLIIVSPTNETIIRRELAEYNLTYVLQDRQLGTGHAVICAREHLDPNEEAKILVLYGDHPFFTAASLQKISALAPKPVAMLTVKLSDFQAWRHNFYHWGRVIRNEQGQIEKIVEFKDASDEEKAVTEVNPALMCFDQTWLLDKLPTLENNNRSGEYYLTDLIKIAFDEKQSIISVEVEPHEAMGINSPEELAIAEELLSGRLVDSKN